MTTKQQISEEQRRRALRHWLVFGLLAETHLRAATRPRPCCAMPPRTSDSKAPQATPSWKT